MDDPWGSPWAEEAKPTINAHLDTRKDVKSSPPTTDSLKVEDSGILPSPWSISDDGFGDWAAMPTEEPPSDASLGSDPTKDNWVVAPKPIDAGHWKNGPEEPAMLWNDSPTKNSDSKLGLSPNIFNSSVGIARQPSPDPWSTTGDEHSVISKDNSAALKDHAEGPNNSVPKKNLDDLDIEQDADNSDQKQLVETSKGATTTQHSSENPHPNGEGTVANRVREFGAVVHDQEEPNPVISRPSMSSSEHSRHDESFSESSRTSLDDGHVRPRMPRQVSSKVHELVEHFDGLAKAEPTVDIGGAVGSSISGKSHSRTTSGISTDSFHRRFDAEEETEGKGNILEHLKRNKEEKEEEIKEDEGEGEGEGEGEDDDDFGDFEEGNSEADEEETPIHSAQALNDGTIQPRAENIALPASASSSVQSTPRKSTLKRDFGRIQFRADDSHLHALFPGTGHEVSGRIFVPDIVPHDSFSSVEERKTWYRISRYGTMRMHNAGTEDSYVRATWAQSEVRKKTLEIVARWIEEDRISGRVVLGGGSKGSSLFGWNDANATPVPLAAAFAAKHDKKKASVQVPVPSPEIPREWPQGLVRSRSTSKSHSSQKPRKRSSTKSSNGSVDLKNEPQLPSAAFGWSFNGPQDSRTKSPTSQLPLEKIAATPNLLPRKSSVSTNRASVPGSIIVSQSSVVAGDTSRPNETHILSPIMQTPVTAIRVPEAEPPAPKSLPVDDDDWGEMISSPATSTAPTFASLTGAVTSPVNSSIANDSERLGKNSSMEILKASSANVDNNLFQAFSHTSRPANSQLGSRPTTSSINDDIDPWASPTNGSTAAPVVGSLLFNTFDRSVASTEDFVQLAPGVVDPKDLPEPSEPSKSTVSHQEPSLFDTPPAKPATSVSTSVNVAPDPWASADFSFFDTTPIRATTPSSNTKHSTGSRGGPMPGKTVSFSATIPSSKSGVLASRNHTPSSSVSSITPSEAASAQRGGKSKAETEQERLVASIVKALPDLSYMLRR